MCCSIYSSSVSQSRYLSEEEILKVLQELRDERKLAIFAVTHGDQLASLADRVFQMSAGQLALTKKPSAAAVRSSLIERQGPVFEKAPQGLATEETPKPAPVGDWRGPASFFLATLLLGRPHSTRPIGSSPGLKVANFGRNRKRNASLRKSPFANSGPMWTPSTPWPKAMSGRICSSRTMTHPAVSLSLALPSVFSIRRTGVGIPFLRRLPKGPTQRSGKLFQLKPSSPFNLNFFRRNMMN